MQDLSKSNKIFEEAQKYIPGGVNSPVRAFKSVGMNPIYIERGYKSYIFDLDGNKYIDYISSWGPLILGHSNTIIQKAIKEELKKGTSYGACNKNELIMAKMICDFFPSIEKVRMVNSGTEATMSAVRLARGYTKKSKIIKFDGCYHGHADSFLINAGSGLATFGTSGSAGISPQIVSDTLVATYNDIDSVRDLITKFKDEIAAVILEPIMGNMGVILPKDGFLKDLRKLTLENDILLIFDEVISGFRAAKGGAQEVYDIKPDISCLGKIIGGGLPVGAFGGKAEIMDNLSPLGNVYQAGTLSGNPLAMAAGIAMLKELSSVDFHKRLEEKSLLFEEYIKDAISPYKDKLSYNRAGSLSTLFFKSGGVYMNEDAKASNTDLYGKYFREMIARGIYLPPSQFECMFISIAHTEKDFEHTAKAIKEVLPKIL